MAGNPNWWGMMNNTMHPQSHHQLSSQFAYVSNSPLSSSNPSPADHHLHSDGQDFPVRSWSQLLLGGLATAAGGGGGDERYGANIFQQQKKLENWEDQVMLNLNNDPSPPFAPRLVGPMADVKQEDPRSDSRFYGALEEGFDASELSDSWPCPALSHRVAVPVSSPASCVTTLSGNILSFSGGTKPKDQTHDQERSSECNSRVNGGAAKKARVTQPSSAQPALKVRKEKLGDRISTLHQLVSPFGKTDTASVLSEAIGYIRFLQGQIEALSCPYMRNASESSRSHQHSVQERNCLLTDEPCQFLNDFDIDGGRAPNQDLQGRQVAKDLRSRGLCLVPIDCTQHVGNENGADYWAQAAFGGGF